MYLHYVGTIALTMPCSVIKPVRRISTSAPDEPHLAFESYLRNKHQLVSPKSYCQTGATQCLPWRPAISGKVGVRPQGDPPPRELTDKKKLEALAPDEAAPIGSPDLRQPTHSLPQALPDLSARSSHLWASIVTSVSSSSILLPASSSLDTDAFSARPYSPLLAPAPYPSSLSQRGHTNFCRVKPTAQRRVRRVTFSLGAETGWTSLRLLATTLGKHGPSPLPRLALFAVAKIPLHRLFSAKMSCRQASKSRQHSRKILILGLILKPPSIL